MSKGQIFNSILMRTSTFGLNIKYFKKQHGYKRKCVYLLNIYGVDEAHSTTFKVLFFPTEI